MQFSRIVDLTQIFKDDMPGFRKEVSKTIASHGWNASLLHIYSHAGTHMDAPLHFEASHESIDQLEPVKFILEGLLVRIPEAGKRMLIGRDILEGYSKEELKGKAVLIHTGWSRFADQPGIYRNRLPRISEELATYLVEQKVALLGVEPPSVADVNDLEELTLIHKILMEGGVTIVEGLTNLDQLSGKSFYFMALPLKIHNGDGAPARAIALEL